MAKAWIIAVALLASATCACAQERYGRPPSFDRPPLIDEPRSIEIPRSIEVPRAIEVPSESPVLVVPPPPLEPRYECTRHFDCDEDCRRASGFNFCPDHCKRVVCD